MIYFDTAFIVRLFVEEPGYEIVRAVASPQDSVQSSIVGKIETETGFHRKIREGTYDRRALLEVNRQMSDNVAEGLLFWLPLTAGVIDRLHDTFLHLPANVFLRTGDAIHLATAAEAGFKEIYSNDRHLLAAAHLFKLKGINPLAK
jgi:predicted nucleic acid-binding protein